MTKPTIQQRKDIKPEKDITGLETPPLRSQEVAVLIRDSPKGRLVSRPKSFALHLIGDHWNNAWCRLLVFWCAITTLSSVISIYYAIDAQNRLYEATENVVGVANDESLNVRRYRHFAHRYAPFFERASAARRHRKRGHRRRYGSKIHNYAAGTKKTNTKTSKNILNSIRLNANSGDKSGKQRYGSMTKGSMVKGANYDLGINNQGNEMLMN